MKGRLPRGLALLASLGLSACGSDGPRDPTLDMLDPAAVHYGKTYAEWAASWVSYAYSVAPPDCINPFSDATGASCTLYQDPQSPVFFLVGNFGGVSIRTECVVPSGKPLFFPLVNVWGDNAGVPADMTLSDADLKNFAEANFDSWELASLRLTVDGQELPNLERGALRSAPYIVNLPAVSNPYTCMGIEGVEGEFPGYASGYWALLPPLSDGPHSLRFGGAQRSASPSNDVTIDARYDLSFQ